MRVFGKSCHANGWRHRAKRFSTGGWGWTVLSYCYLGFSNFWKFWKCWKIINKKYFKNFQRQISNLKTEYMWKNHIRCICVQNFKSIYWKMTSLGILKVGNDHLSRCFLGFPNFHDFQILSGFGHSKSVLGLFFALLTKNWPINMYRASQT